MSRTELAIPELGLVFPVSINEETGSVETRSSQYLGKFGKYYIYDTFLDTDLLGYVGSESGLLSATLKFSEEYGTYGFFGGTAYTINNKTGEFLAMLCRHSRRRVLQRLIITTTSAGWWRHISCQFQRRIQLLSSSRHRHWLASWLHLPAVLLPSFQHGSHIVNHLSSNKLNKFLL